METADRYKDVILSCFSFDDEGRLIKLSKVSKTDSGPLGFASERLRKDGYKDIKVCCKKFLSHRVVWLLHTGDWPKLEIDHINFDRSDNRITNLREATVTQNRYRTSVVGSGKSKHLGVRRDSCGYWVASIGGRYLGYFKNEQDAALAYNEAAIKYYGEFAKFNEVEA